MPAVIAVVGPTATGKSALAVAIAQRLNGEVVNADSMQLYQGMDIGTAKPTTEQRQGVRHHLLDVWDVRETASVADYQRRARACIDRLLADSITPVLVGGSGLYLRAVLDRIEFPGTDPKVRAELEADLLTLGAPGLHARLRAVDPAAAQAISAENGRKIVRALEVIALTGRPFTAALPGYDAPFYETAQIGLDLPTAALDARIGERLDVMIDNGFVEEVRALEAIGLREGVTASRALGYSQILSSLDGRVTLAQAVADTARATRRFVRRQRSWFRRDPRIRWFPPAADVIEPAVAFATAE